MADSDITITDLTPTSGTQSIKWTWEVVGNPGTGVQDYVQYETTEIWTASVNNRNVATKAGEGISDFTQYGLTRGEIVFAWARARTKGIGPNGERYYGEWSEGTTNGVEGREASGDVLLEINGYWRLPNGLIFQWGSHSGAGGEAVVFPIPFPNQVLGLAAGLQLVGAGPTLPTNQFHVAMFDNVTVEGFFVYQRMQEDAVTGVSDRSSNWIALGF